MELSVIIPCKNEAGTVEHLLDSLVAQSQPASKVIVVDSHSDDATINIVQSYSKRLPLVIIKAKGEGVTPARNEGAAQAATGLLLFVDADVCLPKNFLEQLTHQVKSRSLQVGGFSQRMTNTRLGMRIGARLMNGYVRLMALTSWPIFFSCFFATKEVHEHLHGFDQKLWIMEDYDYAYRAHKAGATFGLIRGTYFQASDRRFTTKASQGIFRAIYAEAYRYTHGMRITSPLFTYKMGGGKKH